jgi:hypothetical protein
MMNVPGASVVLEDTFTGAVLASGYTNNSGTATLTVDKGHDILVTIFAQDFYPYQEIIYESSRVADWPIFR